MSTYSVRDESKERVSHFLAHSLCFWLTSPYVICHVLCISNPPQSVRIEVGVGVTPVPECGAQSKQTSMHVAKNLLTRMTEQTKNTSDFGAPDGFSSLKRST